MSFSRLTLGRVASIAAVSLSLIDCGGTETGNPGSTKFELRVTALSTAFDEVAVGKAGPGLRVDQAFIALDAIRLTPCASGVPAPDFGSSSADLAARPLTPLQAEGEAGRFCGAYAAVAPQSAGSSSELDGLSVLLRGTRRDGAPFELSSSLSLELVLQARPAGTSFESRTVLLAFDLATWLRTADIDGAEVVDGRVLIDATHNAAALAAFEAEAPKSLALYDDPEGDGTLAGDAQPPIAGP